MKRKPKLAANFDQGAAQVPTIVCINQATVPFGDFNALVAAMQEFVDSHFAPVWGTPCNLIVGTDFQPGCWTLLFVDNADVANAAGYHDLGPNAEPLSHVFVQTTLQAGMQVSVTASHELAEMLVDPGIQMAASQQLPNGSIMFYAYETADAVEGFSFPVNGIPMTNFVYPSWFEGFRQPGSDKFDHMGLCTKPFQLLKSGYIPIFSRGRWQQIFGSKLAQKKWTKESHPRCQRRGHSKRIR